MESSMLWIFQRDTKLPTGINYIVAKIEDNTSQKVKIKVGSKVCLTGAL